MDDARGSGKMKTIEKWLDAVCLTPSGFFGLVVLAVIPLFPPFNQQYLIRFMVVGIFMAAQAVAFDFTGGYINIVNFGFAAFVGVGAYTSAIMVTKFGLSPWVGLFLAVIPSALLGFLTGILTLRLRGMFAAVIAWFLGLALMGVTTKWVSLTEGPLGLNCPTLLKTSSNLPYFYIILVMLVVVYVVSKSVARSAVGLAFKAIGQNMEAAKTSGINPTRYRIMNFTLSCAFAGWLGGFYAHYYGILMPEVMHTSKTVEVLVISYIGGRGTLWGGALIAIPFVYGTEMLRSLLSDYPGVNLWIYSVVLILIMIYYPGGAAGFYLNVVRPYVRMLGMRLKRDNSCMKQN